MLNRSIFFYQEVIKRNATLFTIFLLANDTVIDHGCDTPQVTFLKLTILLPLALIFISRIILHDQ